MLRRLTKLAVIAFQP